MQQSTKMLNKFEETSGKTIHGTRLRRRVPAEPWKRKGDHAKEDGNILVPKAGKVSLPMERCYEDWKSKRLRSQGADYTNAWFKTRVSASAPRFFNMPKLAPSEFKSRQRAEAEERERIRNAPKGDQRSSADGPAWFDLDRNNCGPSPSHKAIPYKGRTMLRPDKPKTGAPKAELSMMTGRSARKWDPSQKKFFRQSSANVDYVRACVRQGVEIWRA